jgi:effector-binding domain-containing protein
MTAFPESPFGAFDRITLDATPLAVIRHEGIRIDDLRDAFDTGYNAIAAQFAAGTLVPRGPALAIYHGDPMDVFDLELGFPVETAPPAPIDTGGGDRIIASALPTGDATATTHLGPYDGLGTAWAALVERTRAAGLSSRGILIDVYVSDPSAPAGELRTDLVLPVA